MRFLRNVLATIVGLFLFCGLFILILSMIAGSAASDQEVEVDNHSILKIELDKPIVEREEENPLKYLPIPRTDNRVIGLINLKNAIKKAKEDDRIDGIYLDAGLASGGMASLKEIRDALLDFKSSGKFILSYSKYMNEAAYYVASTADELYLNPQGVIEFNGFFVQTPFFKNTLEKIGVEPRIFRVGDFKSAVEPYIRTSMSEPSRLQTESYLNSTYTTYLKDISENTGLSSIQLKNLADSIKVNSADDAEKFKMIKGVAYYDEVLENLKEKVEADEIDDIEFISLNKYESAIASDEEYSSKRVAVIVANGQIVDGEAEGDMVGGETFSEEIRKARLDDNVKAVVLRINSPGGSALASDIIWREVVETKKVKPVIASMSDVAASGGYYIAMGCDTIVAQPNTITGSIGIFGIFWNTSELFEKLGVSTDIVSTSPYADIFNPTSEMSDYEEKVIQQYINNGYETFVGKAAEGRNMSVEDLKKVASGRVWTGEQAKERKLVDVMGGLDDAIQIALDKANLEDDYRIKYYPETKNFYQQLMEEFDEGISAYQLKSKLGIAYPIVKQLEDMQYVQGIQARLPYDIDLK